MEVYIGTIMMFAGNFAPQGWALCNGQLLSIAQYTALFSILGTSFGGDGVRTFALPDMQGRSPIHWGNGLGLSPIVLGEQGGVENASLTINNMPVHTHAVNASTAALANAVTPANNLPGGPANGSKPEWYSNGDPNVTMSPKMISAAGGSQPFPIRNPYLGVTFIIALNGIFPSRG